MKAALRIAPFLGGVVFIAFALAVVLFPLVGLLDYPDRGFGDWMGFLSTVVFFGIAPAFVGVRLIRRATGSKPAAAVMPPVAAAPPVAAVPPRAHPFASEVAPFNPTDRSALAATPSYEASLPAPPSVRRQAEAEATAATADGGPHATAWSDRLRAFAQNSLGLAIVVAVCTIPLMILADPGGAYVATLALMIYAAAEIGRSAVRSSWFISALTSAGTGIMLFVVLAATAGALQQGEGNNPVLVLPGMLFYGGVGLTGITRLFTRR